MPVVTFRVSAAERAGLAADAARAGVSVNELARRRALGDGPNLSTKTVAQSGGAAAREIRIDCEG